MTVRIGPSSKLDIAEVFQDLIVEKGQAVGDAEVILVKCKTFLRSYRLWCDREVGSADFLPVKEVADGINRLKLEIEIWFKMKFHSRLEKKTLSVIRDWEDSNNHPGIRGELVVLLGRTQKKVKVCLQKRVEILLPHLVKCSLLILICRLQAIPVERAGFPIENLQFAFPAIRILESIGKTIR